MRLEGQGNNQQFRQGILAAALLVIVIGGGVGIGIGAGTTSDPCGTANVRQCGSQSLTVLVGGSQIITTVTFPQAFLAPPSTIQLTSGTIPTASTGVTIFVPFCFLCTTSPRQTWTGMPAITTEIFGDLNHRVFENPQGGFVTGSAGFLTVLCILPSTSATAFLKVQFSTDGGGTWTDFGGTNHLDVSSTSACSFSPQYLQTDILITTAFTFNQGFFMRVVGVNGNGVGDNPQFNMVQALIEFQVSSFVVWIASATVITATNFRLTIRTNIALTTSTGPLTINTLWEATL